MTDGGSGCGGRTPLRVKLSRLPAVSGVYIFKDAAGRILYVGKAKNLRSRVRSYFNQSSDTRLAVQFIERHVADLEVIKTGNEKEALLLERNLIKKLLPRYNICLRDDKSFLHLRIDRSHPFPAIVPVRRPRRDGALYLGPYTSASAIRQTLRLIRSFLPLRDCSDRELAQRSRPCLAHHLRLCAAPCADGIDREEYARLVEEAIAILQGRGGDLRARLELEMARAAGRLEFERAAVLRDQLAFLDQSTASQKVEAADPVDLDVVGFFREGPLIEVVVLYFREGKLVTASPHTFESDLPADEALSSFLLQLYVDGASPAPREILVSEDVYSVETLVDALRETAGHRVAVRRPARGPKRRLVEMACENARLSLGLSAERMGLNSQALDKIGAAIGLAAPPRDIDCCDISNTSGRDAVGVIIRFRGGEAHKDAYRRYAIRCSSARDDTAMMREVLGRRFRRARETADLPDLLIVDGGRGQLNTASAVMRDLGLEVTVAGLAKAPRRGRAVRLGRGEEERLFLENRRQPIVLDPESAACHLLQRIRDEAHRFAISYHRHRRRRTSLAKILEGIPGLGPIRARRLLSALGGLQGLRRATTEELQAVPGIGVRLAAEIHRRLHSGAASGDEPESRRERTD